MENIKIKKDKHIRIDRKMGSKSCISKVTCIHEKKKDKNKRIVDQREKKKDGKFMKKD